MMALSFNSCECGDCKLIVTMCSHPHYAFFFFFLIRRLPPRSTLSSSSAASDVYKRQH